jgi:hypothetical protein
MYQQTTDWLGNKIIISTPINTSKSNNNSPNVSIDNIIESKKQQISLQDPTSLIGDWNEVREYFNDPFRGRYPNSPTYNIGNLLGANLYDGPSTKYKIIEVLNHYDQVKVIDKKGDWLLVYTLNGNLGCVKSKLIKRH